MFARRTVSAKLSTVPVYLREQGKCSPPLVRCCIIQPEILQSDWSALYSSGSEILEHLESIVSRYRLTPYIKLRHELTYARYDEATGKWHVRIKRPSATSDGQYEEFDDECDFLFMGVGILSRWEWPDISGLKDYKGLLVHSANWSLGGAKWEEDVKEWGDKNVAVIGLVRMRAGGLVRSFTKCV